MYVVYMCVCIYAYIIYMYIYMLYKVCMVYGKRNKVYLKKAEFLSDRVYVKQNKTNKKKSLYLS